VAYRQAGLNYRSLSADKNCRLTLFDWHGLKILDHCRRLNDSIGGMDGKGHKSPGEIPKTVKEPNLSKPVGVPEGRLGGPAFSPNAKISVC